MKEVYGRLWDIPCDLRVVSTSRDTNRHGMPLWAQPAPGNEVYDAYEQGFITHAEYTLFQFRRQDTTGYRELLCGIVGIDLANRMDEDLALAYHGFMVHLHQRRRPRLQLRARPEQRPRQHRPRQLLRRLRLARARRYRRQLQEEGRPHPPGGPPRVPHLGGPGRLQAVEGRGHGGQRSVLGRQVRGQRRRRWQPPVLRQRCRRGPSRRPERGRGHRRI